MGDDTDWEGLALRMDDQVRRLAGNKSEYLEGLKVVVESLESRRESAEDEPFEDLEGEDPDFEDGDGELDFG